MGLNVEIFSLIDELIDRSIFYFDEEEVLEIAEEPDIVSIVSTILQVSQKRKMYKPKVSDPQEDARLFIINYIEEYYL